MIKAIFTFFLTFLSLNAFSQIEKPALAIYISPLQTIGVDPTLTFGTEIVFESSQSLLLSYGYGSKEVFKDNRNLAAHKFGIGYKKFLKELSINQKGGIYWGTEYVYKKALQGTTAHKLDEQSSDPTSLEYIVNVNVHALRMKLGATFFPQIFPYVDASFGLGIKYFDNYNQNLPNGFSFSTPTMYNRLASTGIAPSINLDIKAGLGFWKK